MVHIYEFEWNNDRLGVESKIDKGSVFQFTLPYKLKPMKGEVELFSYNEDETLNYLYEGLDKYDLSLQY